MTRGQFVYYPGGFSHTLRTTSGEAANYAVLKWCNAKRNHGEPLSFGHFDSADYMKGEVGFHPRLVFEGATGGLRKLHCHASTLTPGAGYDAHIDAHDVAIIVLKGEVEILGQCLGPHALIFYTAGEPHDLRNVGSAVAEYVVFEFHGR